jgi:hypothetical protein
MAPPPSDTTGLDASSLKKLRLAAEEVAWLLARDYPAEPVSAFVAEHRALAPEERALLATNARLAARVRHHIARELDPEDVCRRALRLDAESLVTTVAAAQRGRQLLKSAAGLMVDPTYRRGHPLPDDPLLDRAVARCCQALVPLRPKRCIFLVDEGQSDADRLAEAIMTGAKAAKLKGAEVERVEGVVDVLDGAAFVVSSDPTVVDRCATWMNLVPLALEGEDVCEPLTLE